MKDPAPRGNGAEGTEETAPEGPRSRLRGEMDPKGQEKWLLRGQNWSRRGNWDQKRDKELSERGNRDEKWGQQLSSRAKKPSERGKASQGRRKTAPEGEGTVSGVEMDPKGEEKWHLWDKKWSARGNGDQSRGRSHL